MHSLLSLLFASIVGVALLPSAAFGQHKDSVILQKRAAARAEISRQIAKRYSRDRSGLSPTVTLSRYLFKGIELSYTQARQIEIAYGEFQTEFHSKHSRVHISSTDSSKVREIVRTVEPFRAKVRTVLSYD